MAGDSKACRSCGAEDLGDALFCPRCGKPRGADDAGDPLLGQVVGGRYLLQERLGNGGSGTIYRAEHVTLRRKVAVKVLHHELSRDDLAVERFRREATTVGEIDNAHIVQIHDFGRTEDGRLYLAMEFLDGETLGDRLSRVGRLSADDTIEIIIQLGEALMEAHAIGYVHRDLRPRNVFLTTRRAAGSTYVKLLDFGLAKLVESEGEAASTSLGMTFGDPLYMSPEQARGDGIDRRADIYSLGCIAYEMLTGDPPFRGGKVFDILTRHVEDVPIPPSTPAPETPSWLSETVLRMLAKRPEDRFITVYRMIEALREGRDQGIVMAPERAGRIEAVVAPSVSQAMEKFLPGSEPYRIRPSSEGGFETAVPLPMLSDATEPSIAPVMDRPEMNTWQGVPVTRERPDTGPIHGKKSSEPTPVPGRVATPMALHSQTTVKKSARSAAVSDAGASGKARGPMPSEPTGKVKNAASSAGISAAWYADGEALASGDAIDEKAAEKLRRARESVSLGDSTDEVYFDDPDQGKTLKRVALGAVAVVAIAILFAVWPSGDDVEAVASAPDAGAPLVAQAPPTVSPADAAPAAAAVADAATAAAVTPPPSTPTTPTTPTTTTPATRTPAPTPTTRTPRPDPQPDPDPVRDPDPDPDPVDTRPDPGFSLPGESSAPGDADRAKADFYVKLGQADLRSGNFTGAATHFNKAAQLDPQNAEALTGLGEIALQQNAYSAAIGHLNRAVRVRSSAKTLTLLGDAYLGAGRNAEAADAYKKALKLQPDNPRARDGYNEATGEN